MENKVKAAKFLLPGYIKTSLVFSNSFNLFLTNAFHSRVEDIAMVYEIMLIDAGGGGGT